MQAARQHAHLSLLSLLSQSLSLLELLELLLLLLLSSSSIMPICCTISDSFLVPWPALASAAESGRLVP
jgi:hypothetical protein